MASDRILLELQAVSKSFGQTPVLEAIDLAVRDGEFITILGPSGSGKTTILRMIGGFTEPTRGIILLDGRDITAVPINKRPFNTVFQDYALFPHMNVADNVGYGLKVRGVARAEIQSRVGQALELVQLGQLSQRYPAQLSGGQRQRVALARAIICQPRLILLDEPLAALDVELRRQMQSFLKDIHREIKTTFLFVTHDQEEAIAMADRICVMNLGRIQQLGSPHEVNYRPRTEFVARFFGDNNLVEGKLAATEGRHRRIETALGPLLCAIEGQPDVADAPAGRRAFAVFRPEAIALQAARGGDANRMPGTVAAVSFGGASTVAAVDVPSDGGAHQVRIKMPSQVDGARIGVGDRIILNWSADACRLVLA
jgi:spermidine/putrescine transport system ATP-binding protein